MSTFSPIVKWSGSKRSQASEIVARMPREIETYYEPFCGGCSVLYRLLNTPSVKVSRYVVSDINQDLIGLWTMIKECPNELIDGYNRLWIEFNEDPYAEVRLYQRSTSECYSHRKEYFEKVRSRYNETHSPIDFLFIMRTTTNGMPRYNDNGEFNNSCHFSRPGILPKTLRTICLEWSRVLRENRTEFVSQSFNEVKPSPSDFAYLDPPYHGTKGMYFGKFDFTTYFDWLGKLNCRWLMSFDGIAGDEDMTYDVPKKLYDCHEYLKSGNSSFRRVIGKNRHAEVRESLYMNYLPSSASPKAFNQDSLF